MKIPEPQNTALTALRIIKERDATIAELRAEVERLTTQASVAGEYQVRWMARAERAEADLAEAVTILQEQMQWALRAIVDVSTCTEYEPFRKRTSALLAKVKS